MFRRKPGRRREPMPAKFERLARYNAEVARGLLHSPQMRSEMAALQTEYNAWLSTIRKD